MSARPTDVAPELARRVMVVVAHPDDETIGAGARLGRFSDVLVVHVTDGAPRTGTDARSAGCATWRDYADLRRGELVAAMGLAGLGADRLAGLGLADQGASLAMDDAARRIAGLVEGWRPDAVLTHPYEGGHPDHDATAFAVHAALALLLRDGGVRPLLGEMAFYHDGDADGVTTCQDFLPLDGAAVRTALLDAAERACKRRMLDAHASQAGTLTSFRDDVERYRTAPAYDFTRPPHDGRLNYERFDWGMTGERWRGLAARALDGLGIGGGMALNAGGRAPARPVGVRWTSGDNVQGSAPVVGELTATGKDVRRLVLEDAERTEGDVTVTQREPA